MHATLGFEVDDFGNAREIGAVERAAKASIGRFDEFFVAAEKIGQALARCFTLDIEMLAEINLCQFVQDLRVGTAIADRFEMLVEMAAPAFFPLFAILVPFALSGRVFPSPVVDVARNETSLIVLKLRVRYDPGGKIVQGVQRQPLLFAPAN
jgi:hypothetical protein